jgi:hypothetical protein
MHRQGPIAQSCLEGTHKLFLETAGRVDAPCSVVWVTAISAPSSSAPLLFVASPLPCFWGSAGLTT